MITYSLNDPRRYFKFMAYEVSNQLRVAKWSRKDCFHLSHVAVPLSVYAVLNQSIAIPSRKRRVKLRSFVLLGYRAERIRVPRFPIQVFGFGVVPLNRRMTASFVIVWSDFSLTGVSVSAGFCVDGDAHLFEVFVLVSSVSVVVKI